jgi:2-dehydro-3-deoxygalactonokinase
VENHRRVPGLIGLDWGTSSCRAYLLGAPSSGHGPVLGAASRPVDLMSLGGDPAAFDQVFERLCGAWLDAWPWLPVIACGMVGSRQGWVEAPYRELPADLAAPGLPCAQVRAGRGVTVNVIPGLVDLRGQRGVMRGEETQLLGAGLAGDGRDDQDERVIVLPGTHSKWARLRGSVVRGFTTYLTGELFALLSRHSVLAGLMRPAAEPSWAAFDRGADVAAEAAHGPGLLGILFSARALPLTGALAEPEVADYLSGMIIGAELAGARATGEQAPDGELRVIAEPALAARYERAAVRLGWRAVRAIDHTAPRGLWLTAQSIGLTRVVGPTSATGLAEEST